MGWNGEEYRLLMGWDGMERIGRGRRDGVITRDGNGGWCACLDVRYVWCFRSFDAVWMLIAESKGGGKEADSRLRCCIV